MKLKKTRVVFITTLIFFTFISNCVSLRAEKSLTVSNSINQEKDKNKHDVGEFYGGGIVCWIDSTGSHGYICSLVDLGESVWSNITEESVITVKDTIILTGEKATLKITKQSGHLKSAANLCALYKNLDYGTGVFTDWFLPTRIEVNRMVKNSDLIQKTLINDGNEATTPFSVNYYWTSTEHDSRNYCAYDYDIKIGSDKSNWTSKESLKFVRAFRSF